MTDWRVAFWEKALCARRTDRVYRSRLPLCVYYRLVPRTTAATPTIDHGGHGQQREHCRRAVREWLFQSAGCPVPAQVVAQDAQQEHRPRRAWRAGGARAEGEQRKPQKGERRTSATLLAALLTLCSRPSFRRSSRSCPRMTKTRRSGAKLVASLWVRARPT
jgi:hypothetical protein